MRVVVYTALYGKHSTLKEFDNRGVECVCFTDDKELRSETWKIVCSSAPSGDPPRLRAKFPKMMNVLARDYYDVTIWIDSTITVTRMDRLVAECAASLEGKEIALFSHPERASIMEEVGASSSMQKYVGQDLFSQASRYFADGFPTEHTLYAGGVIARSALLEKFGSLWLDQMSLSLQDQISLPYVLWKLGIEPGVIPGSVYGTDFHSHRWEGPDR